MFVALSLMLLASAVGCAALWAKFFSLGYWGAASQSVPHSKNRFPSFGGEKSYTSNGSDYDVCDDVYELMCNDCAAKYGWQKSKYLSTRVNEHRDWLLGKDSFWLASHCMYKMGIPLILIIPKI